MALHGGVRGAALVAGASLALAALGGCEAVLGLGDLRGAGGGHAGSQDDGGLSSDPKWGCIGYVSPLPAGDVITLNVQFVDLVTMQPVTTTLTANLCNTTDPNCTSPNGSPMTVPAANLTVSVPSSFEGYLDISDPSNTYVPMLVFLDLVAGPKNSQVLLLPQNQVLSQLAAAGVTNVSGTGFLFVSTVDCTNERTAGVSVDMSPSGMATRFYTVDNVPMTGATQTDASGYAGFMNAPPGNVTVTGTLGPGGEELGQVGTIIRNGAMTWQLLRPTPTP